MMTINTHICNWINRSELDYYTMFIKVWIPYNAWYMMNFYNESLNRTTDKQIIDFIKDNSNRYRDKICSLLMNSDETSKYFFNYLSKLHFELEAHPIPNFENKISFSTINLVKNTTKQYSHHFGKFTYFAEFRDQFPRTEKRWICEVLRKQNNQTIHRVELFDWSIEELNNNVAYNAIGDSIKKQQLMYAFSMINPKKPVNIIVQPKRNASEKHIKPKNSIIIDESKNLYFSNDIDIVSKVIVQLIYELRCKLFHGELDPTEANMGVYEQAYNIQKILIKELR